jgi:hypothetical protein
METRKPHEQKLHKKAQSQQPRLYLRQLDVQLPERAFAWYLLLVEPAGLLPRGRLAVLDSERQLFEFPEKSAIFQTNTGNPLTAVPTEFSAIPVRVNQA